MEVFVFKTSVEGLDDARQLAASLNHLVGKGKWNFALDDSDRILRIVSTSRSPESVIQLLANYGFTCAELEDFVPV